jgi:hypothetical protein
MSDGSQTNARQRLGNLGIVGVLVLPANGRVVEIDASNARPPPGQTSPSLLPATSAPRHAGGCSSPRIPRSTPRRSPPPRAIDLRPIADGARSSSLCNCLRHTGTPDARSVIRNGTHRVRQEERVWNAGRSWRIDCHRACAIAVRSWRSGGQENSESWLSCSYAFARVMPFGYYALRPFISCCGGAS